MIGTQVSIIDSLVLPRTGTELQLHMAAANKSNGGCTVKHLYQKRNMCHARVSENPSERAQHPDYRFCVPGLLPSETMLGDISAKPAAELCIIYSRKGAVLVSKLT